MPDHLSLPGPDTNDALRIISASWKDCDKAVAAGLLLQQRFQTIYQERMLDLPLVNTDLRVEAVGFKSWQHCYLGVLITPWFMNLMLLPGEGISWTDLQPLQEQSWLFPSGHYRFIVAEDDHLGHFQLCSLFSPVFEFADHQAARETAHYALLALMDNENREAPDIDSDDIAARWNIDSYASESALEDSQSPSADSRHARIKPSTMTRRQLLRLPDANSADTAAVSLGELP